MTRTVDAPTRVASVETIVSPAPAQPEAGAVRARRRARSRTAVLAALAAFVFIQGGSFVAVDREVVPVRDPIYAEKLALLQGHPEFFQHVPPVEEPLRILAMGSSRTQLAFDAGRVGDTTGSNTGRKVSAFNFGCAGCGPIASALYLRRLLAHGLTADVVLIEVHPAMLAEQDPPFEHRWLHPYRLRQEEIDTIREYGWRVEVPAHLRRGGWLHTTHTFRFAALNEFVPSLLPCPYGMTLASRTDSRGHTPTGEIKSADREVFLSRAQLEYAPAFASYSPGGPAVAAIRDMLAQCRDRRIRASIVVLPESSQFRAWYGPDATEAIRLCTRKLADEFAVPLVDAREWLTDAEFTDGHHTTAAGARTFTDRLGKILASEAAP